MNPSDSPEVVKEGYLWKRGTYDFKCLDFTMILFSFYYNFCKFGTALL